MACVATLKFSNEIAVEAVSLIEDILAKETCCCCSERIRVTMTRLISPTITNPNTTIPTTTSPTTPTNTTITTTTIVVVALAALD